jgi:hypothetical protein
MSSVRGSVLALQPATTPQASQRPAKDTEVVALTRVATRAQNDDVDAAYFTTG